MKSIQNKPLFLLGISNFSCNKLVTKNWRYLFYFKQICLSHGTFKFNLNYNLWHLGDHFPNPLFILVRQLVKLLNNWWMCQIWFVKHYRSLRTQEDHKELQTEIIPCTLTLHSISYIPSQMIGVTILSQLSRMP